MQNVHMYTDRKTDRQTHVLLQETYVAQNKKCLNNEKLSIKNDRFEF